MLTKANKKIHLHLIDTNSFIYETYHDFMALSDEVYFIVFGRGNRHFTDKILALDNVLLAEEVAIGDILNSNDDLKVFFHFLNSKKVKWYNSRLKTYTAELYWIFYGADLHAPLARIKNVSYTGERIGFLDTVKQYINSMIYGFYWRSVSSLIKEIDWFCFWNKYEYDLLKEHFDTKSKFKYFRYFTGASKDKHIEESRVKSGRKIILVNHSGSRTGNHAGLIKKLEHVISDHDQYELLLPLNYGEESYILEVKDLVSNSLFKHYEFLEQRMPKEDYFAKLASATIGVYGYHRQEGAGNIHSLLNTRVQIFLSKKNVHANHLNDVGYVISELESLVDEKMIHRLSKDDFLHNCQLYKNEFSTLEKKRVFTNLVIHE